MRCKFTIVLAGLVVMSSLGAGEGNSFRPRVSFADRERYNKHVIESERKLYLEMITLLAIIMGGVLLRTIMNQNTE